LQQGEDGEDEEDERAGGKGRKGVWGKHKDQYHGFDDVEIDSDEEEAARLEEEEAVRLQRAAAAGLQVRGAAQCQDSGSGLMFGTLPVRYPDKGMQSNQCGAKLRSKADRGPPPTRLP